MEVVGRFGRYVWRDVVILIGLASVAAAVEHQTRRVDLLCRRKGPGPSDRG